MEKKDNSKKKNLKKAGVVLAAFLAGAGTIGGAFALYSASSVTRNNTFNIVGGDKDGTSDGTGNDPVKIEEPHWDPDDAKNLQPDQIVAKDPTFKSNVEYDGWLVARVDVPTVKAEVNGEAGTFDAVKLLDEHEQDLNLTEGAKSAGFTILKVDKSAAGRSTYYFGYDTLLKAGKNKGNEEASTKAGPVFNYIKVQDFTKLDETFNGSVDVTAKVVQNIDPDTGKGYKDVSEAFTKGMKSTIDRQKEVSGKDGDLKQEAAPAETEKADSTATTTPEAEATASTDAE